MARKTDRQMALYRASKHVSELLMSVALNQTSRERHKELVNAAVISMVPFADDPHEVGRAVASEMSWRFPENIFGINDEQADKRMNEAWESLIVAAQFENACRD